MLGCSHDEIPNNFQRGIAFLLCSLSCLLFLLYFFLQKVSFLFHGCTIFSFWVGRQFCDFFFSFNYLFLSSSFFCFFILASAFTFKVFVQYLLIVVCLYKQVTNMLTGWGGPTTVPRQACKLVKLHSKEGRHPDVSSGDLQISESKMPFLGLVSFSTEESAKLLFGEHETIIF